MDKKHKNHRQRTQDNNGGEKKMERMASELKRNPNNSLTSMRLAEMRKIHHA